MIICVGVQKRSGGWDNSQGGALYDTAMIICEGVRKRSARGVHYMTQQ